MANITYVLGRDGDPISDGYRLHLALRKLGVSEVTVSIGEDVEIPPGMKKRKVTVHIGGPDIFDYDLEFDEDD